MTPGLRRLPAAAAAAALSACVMVPKTVYNYDSDCRVLVRQMTLEPVQVASIGGCANDACVALLAAAGVTAAASVVVSGSIAIVGNVVYWLEKQGNCQRGAAPVPPPLSMPPAAPSPIPL